MATEKKQGRGDSMYYQDIKDDLLDLDRTKKYSIKFEKTVYKTLLNLNNEMSSALCGGVKDINDVYFKVMQCLREMEEQDKLYQKMRYSSNNSITLPLLPKVVVSSATMTETNDVLHLKKTQSVEAAIKSMDETVQCSFLCEVPNEFTETESMQDAFKQCLEAFIKDVEEVSSSYLQEVKKSQTHALTPSLESLKTVDDNEKIDGFVCKCKAVHNLHEKLVKQVEACDSFCEFQRKMKENLKVINGRKSGSFCCYHKRLQKATDKAARKREKETELQQPKKQSVATKYSDSLWFTWTPKNNKSNNKKTRQHKQQKKQKLMIEGASIVSTTPSKVTVKKEEEEKVEKTTEPQSTSQLSTPALSDYDSWHLFNTGHLTRASRTLNCVDILEEITEKDLKPIKSEYPRRDDIPSFEKASIVENSFLYQMVYGRYNRNVLEILSSLEPPRYNCTLPTCEKCIAKGVPPKTATDKFTTKKPATTELVGQRKVSSMTVTPPARKQRNKLVTKKPSTSSVSKVKKSVKSGQKETSTKRKVKSKSLSDHSAGNPTGRGSDKIVSKLQKYINDPHLRYRTTITVMPARVLHNQQQQQPIGDCDRSVRKSSASSVTSRDKNRKLWANKYQKSICQHLVSFIEKQDPHPVLMQTKKPTSSWRVLNNKSRSATSTKKLTSTESVNKNKNKCFGDGSSSRKITESVDKNNNNKYVGDGSSSRKMLSNMGILASIDRKGLEENIQKIIDMIELKIIDIISDPKKQNANAFAEIEREIMDVLKEMRAMGLPQKVRKIRQENLKLTALETILDLEMIGDSVINLTNKYKTKSQTRIDLLATSEDSVEEKCMVTSACAPKKEKTVTEINSQKLLTPFMQEIKGHRKRVLETNKKESFHNVIEFLDNLSSMTDDCAIVVFYRDCIEKARIWQQGHVVYLKEFQCSARLFNICLNKPVQTAAPLEKSLPIVENESKTVVVQSDVKQDSTNAETQYNTLSGEEDIIYITTKGHKMLTDCCGQDSERTQYLNQFYGLLFTLMYFALIFDYECA